LYYLIDGLSSSIVFGSVNMYNIVYHIYFIAFLVLIGVINFILTRLVAHKKYEYI
ncbi:teichoic acid transporter, partial [Staphylococcus hominis]